MSIRKMKIDDIEEVRKLDCLAFSAYHTGTRRPENLLSYLTMNPEGCFVAEEKGAVVGYMLSHIWGELAWMGTFGVDPDQRGKGVGKSLLNTVIDFLNQQGCSVMGLETMPDSAYNIGLYLQMGFQLVEPTLVLSKTIGDRKGPVNIRSCGERDFQSISIISRAVHDSLDYTDEVKSALTYGWGETMLFGDDRPDGFAVLRLLSAMEVPSNQSALLQIMVLTNESEERFDQALKQIEGAAKLNGRSELLIPVNGVNRSAIQWLLRCGYRVLRTAARLIYKGSYRQLNGIEIGRWAM